MIYQLHNSVSGYYFECIRYEDFEWPLHLHRHPELIYVHTGQVEVILADRSVMVKEGEFALVLSNRVHAYRSPCHSVVDVVIFSEEHVPFFARSIHGKVPDRLCFVCDAATTEFSEKVLFVTDHIPDLYQRKAALYAILGNYLSQVVLTDADRKGENLLDKIVRYVVEHHTDAITLTGVAKALGYEPHYLSRYFHSRIPMNFAQYVNLYRVSTAETLLRNTDLPITEIAVQSGFQSIRNFNRVYLECTGHTPKEFPRRN